MTHPENVRQFKPGRAKKSLKIEELEQQHVQGTATEQKLDGQRYALHNRPDLPINPLTSRRESTTTGFFVEKQDRVPHISTAKIPAPADTVLDNELASTADAIQLDLPGWLWDRMDHPDHPHTKHVKQMGYLEVYEHVKTTTAIMGSDADRAIRLQEETAPIKAYSFDMPIYGGRDIGKNPQKTRRALLAKVLEQVDPDIILLMPSFDLRTKDEVQFLYDLVVNVRGEGLMLKKFMDMYNGPSAWWKLKKLYTADVVLTGEFQWGNAGVTGKMVGLAGNLEIGVYVEGILMPIGYVSAIMHSEANLPKITDMAVRGELAGYVIEVAYNDLQKEPSSPCGYTLRHPRVRVRDKQNNVWWRDDKSATDCTLSNLLELFREDKAR